MTRGATGIPMHRLNLFLSERQKETLDRLVKLTNASSMAEVVRRAIVFFDVAMEGSPNSVVIIRSFPDGREEKIRVVI